MGTVTVVDEFVDRQRSRRFWVGFASVFDIGGVLARRRLRPLSDDEALRADWDAIAADWEAVGSDLGVAFTAMAAHVDRRRR